MNKKQKKEVREKLENVLSEFLIWLDENYKDHDWTPPFIEKHMADSAYATLEAGWFAYSQGAQDNM